MRATLAPNELGGHAFMTSTLKGVCVWGGGGLEICHVFADSFVFRL